MAKNKTLTPARARIRATKRVLGRDTMSDYRMSSGGLGSIFGNAATTQGHLGRQLSAHNRVIARGMSRLADRNSDRVRGDIGGGQREASNLFGAAGGAAARTNLISGKADAKANRLVSTQAARGGKTLARAGNEAMAIQGQAVQEAAAGADYALANALAQRNQENAAQIADQRFQLAQDRQDARQAERYLALQNGGGVDGASPGFSKAASDLQALASDPNATEATIRSKAAALAIQYNLNPKDKAKLASMVDALYGANDPGNADAVISSAAAREFTAAQGSSPSAILPAAGEASLNLATQRAFAKGDASKDLTTAEAMDIMQVTVGPDGKYVNAQGQPIAEVMVQAGLAYIMSTWARLQARAEGGTDTATGSTTTATPAAKPSGVGLTGTGTADVERRFAGIRPMRGEAPRMG